jgi:hypothetical protein
MPAVMNSMARAVNGFANVSTASSAACVPIPGFAACTPEPLWPRAVWSCELRGRVPARIGVGADEPGALHAAFNHVVNSIATAAADTNPP